MRKILALLGAAGLASLAFTVSSSSGAAATTCTDTLAPGTYGAVTVPAGAVCIIAAGPLTIRGGVTVEEGATFVFGDENTPDVTATITGGVTSTNAMNVQIHFATINGGVDLEGGAGPFGGPFGVAFDTIEDSRINGSVTINGYNGFWHGFIRNTVNGHVEFDNNTVVDTDGNEVVTNVINGGLACSGNAPAPQVGDSGGDDNIVRGATSGQCAGF
jgi:hypothetical protein